MGPGGADNLSGGIAATSFIAYLSSLTHTAYTATQYALFSSLMTLPGKFTSGFSGIAVDTFGYPLFFVGAGVLGHAWYDQRNASADLELGSVEACSIERNAR